MRPSTGRSRSRRRSSPESLALDPPHKSERAALRFQRGQSDYVARTFDETRHTLGARLWTPEPKSAGIGLDLEGGIQWSCARDAQGRCFDIRAWYVAGQVGYRFDGAWSPSLGVYAGLSSGDGNAADRHLETFRAPSPPGRYFGETNPLGPGNIAGVRPFLDLRPTPELTITPQVQVFWSLSQADSIYGVEQSLLRGSAGGESYLGVEPALVVRWSPETS